MTFLQHLEELRHRLRAAVIGLAVSVCVTWTFVDLSMEWLMAPLRRGLETAGPGGKAPAGDLLLAITPAEAFAVHMKVALFTGFLLAAPWVFFQVWRFVSPGLKAREKRMALPFVFFTSAFFLGGVYFCHRVILPFALRFFYTFGAERGIHNQWTLESFWNFEAKFLLGMGLVFELPVLILLLSLIGLVTAKGLLKGFRWAVLGAFIAGAIITPTPDPINQTLVAGPLLALYLLGVLVAAIFGKKRPAD